jgi:hypothetical protein
MTTDGTSPWCDPFNIDSTWFITRNNQSRKKPGVARLLYYNGQFHLFINTYNILV